MWSARSWGDDLLEITMSSTTEAVRARARVLIDELPLVTYVVQLEAPSPTIYVSPQFEALFGYSPDECTARGDFWLSCMVPADRPPFLEAFQRMRETRESMSVEYRVLARDGREVWVRDFRMISADEDGRALVHGYLTDMTREKELERQLASERAQADAFFRDSAVGLGITDAEGRYVRVNQTLARMNGVPAGEHIGRTLREIAPAFADQVTPLLEEVSRSGVSLYQHEIEFPTVDGPGFALLSYFPIDAGGETQYGRIVIDITDRRRAQREHAASQEQYRRLIEQLPLVTYLNNLQPVFENAYVSPQIEKFGHPAEAFIENPHLWDSIVHPDDLDAVCLAERKTREHGDPFELEYRFIRPDGTTGWLLDLMETTLDANGIPLYEQGFIVDVTARKQSEELFRAVFDNAYEAMVITDDNGRYVDVNPAACELFGRSRSELLGDRSGDAAGSSTEEEQTWRTLATDGSAAGLHTVVRPDGEVRETEFAAKANVLPGRHLSVLRDVTERRDLERELWRAQRLESVGRLAGGVAHDFNNMLTAIRGYAHLLLAAAEPGTTQQHHAQEIDDAAARAASLTAQLLAFGRRQVLQARPVHLNELLQNLADMLSRLAGDHVTLELELDPALDFVRVDPAQVEQVLVNLVANAADAMDGTGRITVRTANADVHGADERPDLPAGHYAVLSVEDSGPGIDEATLEQLFEPFFTTKDVGRGIGLGLATAYGIAKQSEGTITVSTELGVGSTFSVYLPATEDPQNG
jgi:two-component system, cell cycle sensor histidine kinase and response regulator CckA